MQEHRAAGGSRTGFRERPDTDVSALTGFGLIVHIASLVMRRVLDIDVGTTLVGLVAVALFGTAVVVAIRRRLLRAMLLPLLLFVLSGASVVLRIA